MRAMNQNTYGKFVQKIIKWGIEDKKIVLMYTTMTPEFKKSFATKTLK